MDTYTTELAAWTAVVGVMLPLVISVIQQSGWAVKMRSAVTAAVSIAAAVGTVYYANPGGLEAQPLIITAAAVLTLAGSTYRTVWKPTGIAGKVEQATNIGNPPTEG